MDVEIRYGFSDLSKNTTNKQPFECKREIHTTRSFTEFEGSIYCSKCFTDKGIDIFLAEINKSIERGSVYLKVFLQFWAKNPWYGQLDQEYFVSTNPQMFIHPKNHHFSSPFAHSVPIKADFKARVQIKVVQDLPYPYSECQNVDQNVNEKISFYANDFDYSKTQCTLTCHNSFFMNSSVYWDNLKGIF